MARDGDLAENQVTKQAYFWSYFKINHCQAEGWERLNRYPSVKDGGGLRQHSCVSSLHA